MNNDLTAKWEKGKVKTLRFYEAKLPWKNKQFNKVMDLPAYFGPLIGDKKEVKIAELGCGMFCTIGSTWKDTKVTVFPSDALANDFNQILKRHNVIPLVPVTYEDMENLTHKDDTFDIVHCCNALDHCVNPLKAVKEMYRILKPGGYIYLRHFSNVGEREGYAGLHNWNINMAKDNDCIIWNRQEKFLFSEHFKGFTTVMKKEMDYETEDMVVSILKKT